MIRGDSRSNFHAEGSRMTLILMHRRIFLGSALTVVCSPVLATKLPAPKQVVSKAGVTLAVRDLSPRFLDFYMAARAATPDERFRIWKDRYTGRRRHRAQAA